MQENAFNTAEAYFPESNARIYCLKVPNSSLRILFLILLVIFLSTFPVMDIPMSDASFLPHITAIAMDICKISIILLLTTTVIFSFYRRKITVSLDENGIQIPTKDFLFWEKILWYRIDPFSANGLRRIILKTADNKIIITADDDAQFEALVKDLKHLISTYNPMATDYNGSKTSRLWGYFYIIFLTGIHLTISYFTDFEVKYLVIFTPVLLISILAIFIEKIKKPN